ncbi:MAG: Holliday junction resolvase RuvX [Planctomycetia bacterium]|nr:Holliday junction resolvase RuvX [Planctomycetia bacterium]
MPTTNQPNAPSPGRVAGIDFGTVRLGIALSDARRSIASPFANYTRRSPPVDAEHFRRLVADEGIALFVVGLPVHLDGRESAKSRAARRFGQWLHEATGVTVEFFDERFTTAEAEQALAVGEFTKKKRKARLDMLAAQILLTAYLESGGATDAPAGLDD